MVAFLQAAEMGAEQDQALPLSVTGSPSALTSSGSPLSGTLDMDVGGVLRVYKVIGMYTAGRWSGSRRDTTRR